MKKVLTISQEEALRPNTKEQKARIPMVVTYNPDLPPMRRIVNQRWNLYEDERLKKVFKNRPIIAYRKPKNLKDLFVRLKFVYEQEEEKGGSPCNDQRCSWCSQVKETNTFKSETTGKTFSILHNCKSSKIVYLVRCKCCHKHVGRTWRQLNIRFNIRRNQARKKQTQFCDLVRHVVRQGLSFDDVEIHN